MLKKTFLFLIFLYQNIFVYFLKTALGVGRCCRFEITCSEYARLSIRKYGAIRGAHLSIRRLLSCQPFYSGGLAK